MVLSETINRLGAKTHNEVAIEANDEVKPRLESEFGVGVLEHLEPKCVVTRVLRIILLGRFGI